MNPLIHTQVDVYLRRLIAEHIPIKQNPDRGSSHGREAPSKEKDNHDAATGVKGNNDA